MSVVTHVCIFASGTGYPEFLAHMHLGTCVAYLINSNPGRGQASCYTCHKRLGQGSSVGVSCVHAMIEALNRPTLVYRTS